MHRRLANAIALLVALSALFALPGAASAAEGPWWQVLDGSRPTNLWKPTDNVQEIKTAKADVGGEEVLVAKVEVGGETVGCLAAGNFAPAGGLPASFICAVVLQLTPIESAEDLEHALETPYGAGEVKVTGGPAGGEPFIVNVKGKSVPAIAVSPVQPGEGAPFLGTASARVLSSGGSGNLVVTVTNLGDKPVDATSDPVRIVDELPEGVVATGFKAYAGERNFRGPVECELGTQTKLVCTFENKLPVAESIEVEIHVTLVGDAPAAGAPGRISVSGGGAPPKTASQTITVSPEKTPFGIERFSALGEEEGGKETRRAGGHPFQLTTTLQLNAGPLLEAPTRKGDITEQPALPRNVRFTLPAGLIGNTTTVPRCSMTDFGNTKIALLNNCPDNTSIGLAAVTVIEPTVVGFMRLAVPLFNLEPANGEPARFGFVAAGTPVVVDTEVDPDNGYRIVASVRNATQLAQFLSSTVTIWGTPGDPRHDAVRGWGCAAHYWGDGDPLTPCEDPPGASGAAFLRMPVSCDSPSHNHAELEPWNVPLGSVISAKDYDTPPLTGCNQVPFNPTIAASPSSKLASNPSGLEFQLNMPNSGLLDPDATAEGQAKKVEVTLPEGMTINPSQGEGLAGCSPAQLAQERYDSNPGEGCPNASKVGEVQVKTPLLEEEARGSLYVAEPHNNASGSLIALYLVAKIPERGILIRQEGKVQTDPVTGQIKTTFDNLPQLPFSSFKLRFREGGRAPLVTPPGCGTYDVVAKFTPWSAADPDNPTPAEIVTRTSQFTVERGPDGGACPDGGVPPFHPGLLAGTTNNAAGHYSPFDVRLTRKDGEQEFTNFSIKLPPGVIGKLAGIPFCPDAAIAAAKARTGPNGGQEELDNPSCPAASQVGRTLVGAGVGSLLTYVPGKLYLAGPYHGSALSIAAITAAKVGPFDLGTVVIREALKVNPDTAEVFVDATGSDPIPHIIQGIPVHARDIRIYVDRKDFVLNPTSCERTSTASTVLGSGLDFGSSADDQPVTVTSPFQAADCQALGFKPKLSLRLRGGTHRGDTPALEAVVKARKGDANIAGAQVTLPHSEFLEQSHIRTICTRVQFNAGDSPGEKCPAGSVYGHARAITPLLDEPIEGPVYLRSSPRPLPDLVAALHSGKIDVNVVGYIDSVKGGRIRNTFATVPDAPVSKFVLKMQGGKKGLLVNSTNICKGKNRAIADFTGHNGKVRLFRPLVKGASCRKGGKKGKRSHRHHG
jgi:hypothetical protein